MNFPNPEFIVGVDIGGTFTDCVVLSTSGKITIGKALSTPDDFAQGAVNAVADAALNLGYRAPMKCCVPPGRFSRPHHRRKHTITRRAQTGLITTKARRHGAHDAGPYYRWPHRRGSDAPFGDGQTGATCAAALHRRGCC
jgi:hypothetical protein